MLADSVRRKPTPLTVWTVNRVLHQHPSDRAAWMALLESVQGAPTVSDEAVDKDLDATTLVRALGTWFGHPT